MAALSMNISSVDGGACLIVERHRALITRLICPLITASLVERNGNRRPGNQERHLHILDIDKSRIHFVSAAGEQYHNVTMRTLLSAAKSVH